MLDRALAAGVPAAGVTGDEIDGGDRRLRLWLEEQDLPHVLAVKRTEPLIAATERGPAQVPASDRVAALPEAAWVRLSAGAGAKGPRLYDWARLPIRPLSDPDRGYWLLARRSLADPTEVASSVCYGPAATPLAELVRVAGTRWAIEECLEEAKGEVGLDHYEVRRWDGWYRHVTLCLLAHAVLAVTRAVAAKGGGSDDPLTAELLPPTVPEVRRLLQIALLSADEAARTFRLGWSHWRRRHQARARRSHYRRRLAGQAAKAPPENSTI